MDVAAPAAPAQDLRRHVLLLKIYVDTQGKDKKDRFADDVENLKEVTSELLRHCGPRLDTLKSLWSVLTAFSMAVGDMVSTGVVPSSHKLIEYMEGNPCQVIGLKRPMMALLELGPFKEVLGDDLGLALSTLRHVDLMIEEQGSKLDEVVDEILLFYLDAHHILVAGPAGAQVEF